MRATKKTSTSQTVAESRNNKPTPGAVRRIIRKVEADMKGFDVLKKKRATKTIEDMKKIYITH